MESLVKWIFGIIDAIIGLAIVFATVLVIGRAVTGSWDIRDWKTDDETAAVAEYSYEMQERAI